MKEKVKDLINQINLVSEELISLKFSSIINIMEVCGTHTMAIARYGISQLLPKNINLISGPGCPVCVTPTEDIDQIIEIVKNYNVTIYTFGDMIRVPGSQSSLQEQKSMGKKITVCYSPMDALEYAKYHPNENILFLAIGFETTAPLTAIVIKKAKENKIKNFYIYSMHKIVPPALEMLLKDNLTNIKGFLLPGHVSAIIGSKPYNFIAEKYNTPGVISGFEPESILKSILMILTLLKNKKAKILVEYNLVVKENGNIKAIQYLEDVFLPTDSVWRGIGIIKKSGLDLKDEYSQFNAKSIFPVKQLKPINLDECECECGNILKGLKRPTQCKNFKNKCTPYNPLGPCMVSSEGACAAYFKYDIK